MGKILREIRLIAGIFECFKKIVNIIVDQNYHISRLYMWCGIRKPTLHKKIWKCVFLQKRKEVILLFHLRPFSASKINSRLFWNAMLSGTSRDGSEKKWNKKIDLTLDFSVADTVEWQNHPNVRFIKTLMRDSLPSPARCACNDGFDMASPPV